jgi:hypothetical protein
MHVPDEPPIGNLVAYEYLWLSQENKRNDGAKVYPVALIFAKKIIASVTLAYAVGMSHKPPYASQKAIEVPKKLKRHLGLDEDRSWICTDQLNEFTWSGPDLRPAEWLKKSPAHETVASSERSRTTGSRWSSRTLLKISS